MKTLSIAVTYDDTTRELKSVATFTGFVDELPGEIVTSQQIDTTSLFKAEPMTPSDMQAVVQSVARVLQNGNVTLSQWISAAANKDKAGQISASTIDPVQAFDDTLNVGEPAPPSETNAGIIAFDEALNPPS